jgi:hypothetical protein
MRAPQHGLGVACNTPGVTTRMGLCLALCLAAIGLSACGSGSDDAAVSGPTLSTAQQTVGVDLVPPDATIAGTAAVSTDMAAEDMPPDNASSASADDLLPPA